MHIKYKRQDNRNIIVMATVESTGASVMKTFLSASLISPREAEILAKKLFQLIFLKHELARGLKNVMLAAQEFLLEDSSRIQILSREEVIHHDGLNPVRGSFSKSPCDRSAHNPHFRTVSLEMTRLIYSFRVERGGLLVCALVARRSNCCAGWLPRAVVAGRKFS